jgi:D-beta-D-heptose 7-phosphate kinase/D-beta-D-heptose 1-phosphate adenosyltransferase
VTIRKTRVVARNQQVVRVDRERRRGFTDSQRAQILANFERLLPSLDAIILEDYDKGLLDQALVDALVKSARSAGKIVTVDPKPTNPIRWHDVTCVTPNRGEAFRFAGRNETEPAENVLEDAALLEVGAILLEKWRCDHLLITLSEQGMILFDPGQPPHHIPTRAQEVIDVSGAGDTAIAVFTAALAGGATPREAAEISNHASGIVVAKTGTAVTSREERRGHREFVASTQSSPGLRGRFRRKRPYLTGAHPARRRCPPWPWQTPRQSRNCPSVGLSSCDSRSRSG